MRARAGEGDSFVPFEKPKQSRGEIKEGENNYDRFISSTFGPFTDRSGARNSGIPEATA